MVDKSRAPSGAAQPFRTVVLEHVADLLHAAESAVTSPNIAYHLATLALEEIGKLGVVEVTRHPLAVERTADDKSPEAKYFDDHVGKIFWALWTPTFGQQVISNEQIGSFLGLAKSIHDRRLRGLYVELVDDAAPIPTALPPHDVVTAQEVDQLVQLTRQRLAEYERPSTTPASEQIALARWLWYSYRDPERRRFMMSAVSMENLAKLGGPDWIRWLRGHFDSERKLAEEWLKQEASRVAGDDVAEEPKWRVRLRFYTNSHSVRPKAINRWNETVERVKLTAVPERKNELIADLVLPKAVPLASVWDASWDLSQRFLLALNAGTRGFFYWYLPTHTRKFYDQVFDIETKNVVLLGIASPLELSDADKPDALTEVDINHVQAVFAVALRESFHPAFEDYLLGLALIAKTDLHTRLEAQAFEVLFSALQRMPSLFGQHVSGLSAEEQFRTVAVELISEFPADDYLRLVASARQNPAITMENVRVIKLLCDAYLVRHCHERLRQEMTTKTSGAPPPSG